MDETWKVIFEALALHPEADEWAIVADVLSERPRDRCISAEYRDEVRQYMARVRQDWGAAA
jgi:hypothetical protein